MKLKDILFESKTRTFYHVATERGIEDIKKNGLIPRTGERSTDFGEERDAIYLFGSYTDVENALMNWLGDELYPENEYVYVLKIELPADEYEIDREAFEYRVYEPIPPKYITNIEKVY